MTTIRLHRHPLEGEAPQVFEAASIGAWLLAHYGRAAPRDRQIHIYAGEPAVENDLIGNVSALARNDAAFYTVLEAPGDGGLISGILINLAISTVISLVARSMFSPKKPLDNRSQESPNNALTQRENRVRPLERVEDIFGTVRSYPTLLMPTYTKYESNRMVEFSYLCVGRGFHDISDVREADTPLEEIDGSSAKIYAPFNSPNSGTHQALIGADILGPIVNVARSASLESNILKPLNQLQLDPARNYMFYPAGMGGSVPLLGELPVSVYDTIYQPLTDGQRTPNFAAIAEVGQAATISMAPVPLTVTATVDVPISISGGNTFVSAAGAFADFEVGMSVTSLNFSAGNDVTRTITAKAGDGSSVTVDGAALTDEASSAGSLTVHKDYSGTRTIAGVGNGYITLSGPSVFFHYYYGGALGAAAAISVANGLSDWTDWFTLPDVDRTEVWTNVVARQGMYKDDGTKQGASVAYEVQIEQLDAGLAPTGVVETITGSLSGATTNERAETLERVTAWVGPARVRARRTTPFDFAFDGGVVDEITWVDLNSVSPVTKPHFGNKTTVYTVTRATPGATALRSRRLNCLASRRLPTFNGVAFSGSFAPDGSIATGTIGATNRIVDILAAVTIDPQIGNRPIAEIDIAQIYGVQLALDAWNIECGQFNYTFDNDQISYEETVLAIADAAFCTAYRQNGVLRLALDRPQAAAVALYTHRNKKPRAERITRTFVSDSDYDGIELVYMDPDSDVQETIRLPLDDSYTKLKRVEVTGIRSYTQAWFRANREMQRLVYERRAIEVEVTSDARALLPNSRILNVDNTRFRSWDGEVIAQSGLELTLSDPVEFVPAQPHSIVLQTRENGTPQSIAVTAGSASNRVILAAPPAEAVVTAPTPEEGIRTSFSFAADITRGAQAWLVDEIRPTDPGYFLLRARNYASEYYAADALPVPARESVIN